MSDALNTPGLAPAGVPRRWLAADTVMAVALCALLIRSATSPSPVRAVDGPVWLGVAVSVVAAAAVAARRLVPLPALGVAVAACVVSYLLGSERDSFLIVGLVCYIVGSTLPPRRSAPALGVAVTATAAAFAFARPPVYGWEPAPDWWRLAGITATAIAVQIAGWALGLAVYRQRGYLAAVREQADQQLRAERELSGRALAEERLRIARELHDVVAHAMSVITVQAGVARHVLTSRPEQTGQALEAIETTGRQALRDMRQLLGVLRDGGTEAPHAPTPGLRDLDDLRAGAAAAGTAVEVSVRGRTRPLPEGIELSAYRIVQEALTNTVKHAGTDHARVVLTYGNHELAIEVTDDGVGGDGQHPGGHGLIGMRERAALHGGTCTAGPLPIRGFRVQARIPLPEAA